MNTLGTSNAMLSQQDNQTTPPIVINSPRRERERDIDREREREREREIKGRERREIKREKRNKHHLQYSTFLPHETDREKATMLKDINSLIQDKI